MSLPAGWIMVPVSGEYARRNGTPVSGSVTFWSAQEVVCEGILVVPKLITMVLDADGVLTGELPSTSGPAISPSGHTYLVRENWPYGRTFYLEVPHDAAGIDLVTAIPVTPVDQLPAYTDAPHDGQQYGRQDGAWSPFVASGIELGAGTDAELTQTNAAGTGLARAGHTIASLLAAARDRAMHTGSQLASTISDFASAVIALLTWGNISGKPATFDPSAHTHPLADLTQSGATPLQVAQWTGAAWEPATLDSTPVTLAGSFNYLTLTDQQITMFAVNLTTHVTGTLPIASGGTGATTEAGALSALGAEAAGTAASAVATHAALADPHTVYALTASLGTAAFQNSSAFEAAGAVSTHNAVTTAHGISAFGATLVDDADASAGRTTLGLGNAATLNVGTTAGTVAAGDDARITGAVQTSRTISASGLATGGGDLSANRTITVTAGSTAGTVCEGNDARLSDARTPTAHGSSHGHAGGDPASGLRSSQMPDLEIVTESGTTRTMADGDAGKLIRCTNAAGCTVTFPDTLTAGKSGAIEQAVGAGIIAWAVSGSMVATPSGDARAAHVESGGEGSTLTWFVDATNSVIIGGDTA